MMPLKPAVQIPKFYWLFECRFTVLIRKFADFTRLPISKERKAASLSARQERVRRLVGLAVKLALAFALEGQSPPGPRKPFHILFVRAFCITTFLILKVFTSFQWRLIISTNHVL